VPAADESTAGVLFDVDGTLVDTTYLHAVCWGEALRQAGHDVPMATVHRAIGMGSRELLDHLLGTDRDRDADRDIDTAHRTLYKQYWGRLRPLPGAAALLRRCAGHGLVVVLASSANAEELQALRSALDADDVVTAATSSTDAEAGKPHPDILEAALDRSGLAASRVVFVGDSVWDGQAAARLGVPFVGLLCGGTSAAELCENHAVEVWRDPADLLAQFDSSTVSGMNR
jgi:HAD superfamily hydrolase (TIGR01509 family)